MMKCSDFGSEQDFKTPHSFFMKVSEKLTHFVNVLDFVENIAYRDNEIFQFLIFPAMTPIQIN